MNPFFKGICYYLKYIVVNHMAGKLHQVPKALCPIYLIAAITYSRNTLFKWTEIKRNFLWKHLVNIPGKYFSFAVDRSTYIHTNRRNVVSGIHYVSEAMGAATEGLCTLWEILREVRPQQVPACVKATLTTTEMCASPAEVLGIARMSVTSSSQYSPAFAVLYHVALPHRMVRVSWCRLHPVKRLRSVSSSCSEKTACRQP